jgi:hypothetical protein
VKLQTELRSGAAQGVTAASTQLAIVRLRTRQ